MKKTNKHIPCIFPLHILMKNDHKAKASNRKQIQAQNLTQEIRTKTPTLNSRYSVLQYTQHIQFLCIPLIFFCWNMNLSGNHRFAVGR